MQGETVEIRVDGKPIEASLTEIEGRSVVVSGKWLKMATVQDEELVEGESVKNPDLFVSELKKAHLGADIFTFAQSVRDPKPKYDYFTEWDNAAVIPISCFAAWWEGRLSQDTRRSVRKAGKSGLIIRTTSFNDQLIQGIIDIYNETPIRQGRRFRHYGKSFDEVKKETATYLDRSEFIGAYWNTELVGFIKMVYVNQGAHVLHILSRIEHADKRPTNALIAKAVEICAQKGLSYFVYCKYVYGKNDDSPLTEFKRRNGFEQLNFARYYIPLTSKGRIALKAGLHHGWTHLLPRQTLAVLRGVRRKVFELLNRANMSEAKGSIVRP